MGFVAAMRIASAQEGSLTNCGLAAPSPAPESQTEEAERG